jgi:hypothetical protein
MASNSNSNNIRMSENESANINKYIIASLKKNNIDKYHYEFYQKFVKYLAEYGMFSNNTVWIKNYNLTSYMFDLINNIPKNISYAKDFIKFNTYDIGNGIGNLYPLKYNQQIFTFIPNGIKTETHLFAVGHFCEQFFSFLGSNENSNNPNYWSDYAFRNESSDDNISAKDKNELLNFLSLNNNGKNFFIRSGKIDIKLMEKLYQTTEWTSVSYDCFFNNKPKLPELINSSENITEANCIFAINSNYEIIVKTNKEIKSGEQLFLNYSVKRPNDTFVNNLKDQSNPPLFIENCGLSLKLLLVIFRKFNLINNNTIKEKITLVFIQIIENFWNSIISENDQENLKHWDKIPDWVKDNWYDLLYFLFDDDNNVTLIWELISSNIFDQELKTLLSKTILYKLYDYEDYIVKYPIIINKNNKKILTNITNDDSKSDKIISKIFWKKKNAFTKYYNNYSYANMVGTMSLETKNDFIDIITEKTSICNPNLFATKLNNEIIPLINSNSNNLIIKGLWHMFRPNQNKDNIIYSNFEYKVYFDITDIKTIYLIGTFIFKDLKKEHEYKDVVKLNLCNNNINYRLIENQNDYNIFYFNGISNTKIFGKFNIECIYNPNTSNNNWIIRKCSLEQDPDVSKYHTITKSSSRNNNTIKSSRVKKKPIRLKLNISNPVDKYYCTEANKLNKSTPINKNNNLSNIFSNIESSTKNCTKIISRENSPDDVVHKKTLNTINTTLSNGSTSNSVNVQNSTKTDIVSNGSTSSSSVKVQNSTKTDIVSNGSTSSSSVKVQNSTKTDIVSNGSTSSSSVEVNTFFRTKDRKIERIIYIIDEFKKYYDHANDHNRINFIKFLESISKQEILYSYNDYALKMVGWSFIHSQIMDNKKCPSFDKIKLFVDYIYNQLTNVNNKPNNVVEKNKIGDTILYKWVHPQYNAYWEKVEHFSKTQNRNVILWRCYNIDKSSKYNSYIAFENDNDNKGYVKIYLGNNKYIYANLKQHYRYYNKNHHILPSKNCICKFVFARKKTSNEKNINPYCCNFGLTCRFPHSYHERDQWRKYCDLNRNQELPSIFYNSNSNSNINNKNKNDTNYSLSPSLSPINSSNKKRKSNVLDNMVPNSLESSLKKTTVEKSRLINNDSNSSQQIENIKNTPNDGLNIINKAITLKEESENTNHSIFTLSEKRRKGDIIIHFDWTETNNGDWYIYIISGNVNDCECLGRFNDKKKKEIIYQKDKHNATHWCSALCIDTKKIITDNLWYNKDFNIYLGRNIKSAKTLSNNTNYQPLHNDYFLLSDIINNEYDIYHIFENEVCIEIKQSLQNKNYNTFPINVNVDNIFNNAKKKTLDIWDLLPNKN